MAATRLSRRQLVRRGRPVRDAVKRPTLDQLWHWLGEIPDPEIPAISLTDLGVIRDVGWRGDTLVVTVTPTYSGCPATGIINMEIESRRRKLEEYGIAPPRPTGGPARCPRCESTDLERISQFGSTPCKAQWRCRDCLEPFDYFKCI